MGISKGKAAKKTTYKTKRHQFIAAWLRAPFKVGALMPSSRALARALAKRVDITRPGLVIELGAGTGVVTQALLEAGIAPKKLLVIEREPKLHSILEAQFPGLNIICGDAQHLSRVLDKLGNPPVNAIVKYAA